MADDDLLELIEAEAFADLFASAPPGLAEEHGIRSVSLGGGAVCTVVESVPSLMLNRLIGLGVSEPATLEKLDRADDVFGGVRYLVPLAPGAQPPELPDWLRGRGFEAGYAWMKFRRGAAPPPEVRTDLDVVRAGADGGRGFARAVVHGYALPAWMEGWLSELAGRAGWSCYVAMSGAEPAAGGAMYARPPAAWLGMAATLPRYRRRGGQGAIMAARLRDAVALGCTLIATETGERVQDGPNTSYRNIVRYGFEEAYVRPNYASPPDDEVA
jgi:hypothetical protein